MPHLRKTVAEITPRYEDAGLFRNELCNVIVDLIPVIHRNSRNDLVVTGFVSGGMEIAVLFAGRRKADAVPLMTRLDQMRRRALGTAAARGLSPPDIETMRLSVQVEGAWRPRFRADADGFETRSYHLVAARWRVGPDGVFYGVTPTL